MIRTWLCFSLSFSAAVIGDILLKRAGGSNPPIWGLVFITAVLYAATAFGWFYVFQSMRMVMVGVVYPVLSSITLILAGTLLFGEKLSPQEWAGVGFGVVSLVLMGWRS